MCSDDFSTKIVNTLSNRISRDYLIRSVDRLEPKLLSLKENISIALIYYATIVIFNPLDLGIYPTSPSPPVRVNH